MVDSFEEMWGKTFPDLPLGRSGKPKPSTPSPPPVTRPAPPSPPPMRPVMETVVRVGAQVSLDLNGIPEALLKDVQRHLTFRNPLHKAMVRAGRYDPKITEQLTCWYLQEGILYVARGFANRLVRILQAHRIKAVYKDETNKTEDLLNIDFIGELKSYQWDAVRDIGNRRFGILANPIGFGEKEVALYLISQVHKPALVIVRHKWQLYQWREVAEQFLGGVAVGT